MVTLTKVNRVHHRGTERASNTAQAEVVHRLKKLLCDSLCARNFLNRDNLPMCLPGRVEELAEVEERQALTRITTASEMENDLNLHWRKHAVASSRGGVVEEIADTDTAILGLARGFTNDTITMFSAS